MAFEKDNIYEFGFGRTDKVSKSVNLLDEAVFTVISAEETKKFSVSKRYIKYEI